jgi:predicted nucleic acid-binding Zn ribbon protein
MPSRSPGSQVSAESVRTPVVGSPRCCPVCRTTPLEGRQTVCSAACRRARSRQRSAAKLAARDQEIRALLEAALAKLGKGAS